MTRKQSKLFFIICTLFWIAGVFYFAFILKQTDSSEKKHNVEENRPDENSIVVDISLPDKKNSLNIKEESKKIQSNDVNMVLKDTESNLPDGVQAIGRIRQYKMCIKYGDVTSKSKPLLDDCSDSDPLQKWKMLKNGNIRNKNGMCLHAELDSFVILAPCATEDTAKDQVWVRTGTQIMHEASSLCIDAHKPEHGLVLAECDITDTQDWQFDEEISLESNNTL